MPKAMLAQVEAAARESRVLPAEWLRVAVEAYRLHTPELGEQAATWHGFCPTCLAHAGDLPWLLPHMNETIAAYIAAHPRVMRAAVTWGLSHPAEVREAKA